MSDEPFPNSAIISTRRPRATLLALVASCALLITACEQEPGVPDYQALAGKVLATYPDTGELAIRTMDNAADRTVACVVTGDSEIYVNDKLAALSDIQIGDPVEFIGYFDPNPRLEKFVVTFAYFEHTQPPPPRPDLTPVSTQPAAADNRNPQGAIAP